MRFGACEQEIETADYTFRRYSFQGDLADFCAYNADRYPHLLQSVSSGGNHRYDILFAFPEETVVLDETGALWLPQSFDLKPSGFLEALNFITAASQAVRNAHNLPFIGGWFLFLAYEVVSEIETAVPVFAQQGLPRAFAARIPVALIYDHLTSQLICVAESSSVDLLHLPENGWGTQARSSKAEQVQPQIRSPRSRPRE